MIGTAFSSASFTMWLLMRLMQELHMLLARVSAALVCTGVVALVR